MNASTQPDEPDTGETTELEDVGAPSDAPELPEDIASLSYEEARDQLIEVVRRLESGQGGLEESIALWERGEALARRCQQWLDGARTRLDQAVAEQAES